MMESKGRGVLDRPVKPGDDRFSPVSKRLAQKLRTLQSISPRQLDRLGDADPHPHGDLRLARARMQRDWRGVQRKPVMLVGNPKRFRQLARAGAQRSLVMQSAPPPHRGDAVGRLQRADQHGAGGAFLLAVYLSFVDVGQVFYGYGWELLLLETGFLAIFLAPAFRLRSFASSPPPVAVVWLLRWVLFRVMLGAGLIKLRGDPCWVHLTCLVDHYETQPNPGPLSWYFHAMPLWFHRGGALFNHFVELVVPWGYFGPRRIRRAAGALTILFQVILILSGNLSFLNWLTIVVAVSCFDDSLLEGLFSRKLRERVRDLAVGAVESVGRRRTIVGLVILILVLSVGPAFNLLSPSQTMNASFFPLPLVNTYGAFGSVEHERHEVVLEGTRDDVLSGEARWLEYEFPCKPGDPRRRPCFVTPYHYRLDWQMWFAGLSDFRREPWILKLVYELLRGNPAVTSLLSKDPFAGEPPRYVRALLYRYRFTRDHREGWWVRERLGEYLRPLSADDPALREFLARRGWQDP